jgi:hypothetical protein
MATIATARPILDNVNPESKRLSGSQAALTKPTPISAVLGRLTWMLFGPFTLFLATAAVTSKGNGLFSIADGLYWATLGLMLLGRRVEVRSGHALTSEGAPATPKHLRRYAIGLMLVGTAIWVVAHLVRLMFYGR